MFFKNMARVEETNQIEDEPIYFGEIEITNLKIDFDGIPFENNDEDQN